MAFPNSIYRVTKNLVIGLLIDWIFTSFKLEKNLEIRFEKLVIFTQKIFLLSYLLGH